MAEGSVSFDVRAPQDRVWSFLSDLRQVGSCVPGVQAVRILDDRHATWDLKLKIGPLSQRIEVRTETLEQIAPSRGTFRGVSDNMEMTGTIELRPLGEATQVTYTMAVQAKGPLARIVDNFMKSRLDAQTKEFAANVKKALES